MSNCILWYFTICYIYYIYCRRKLQKLCILLFCTMQQCSTECNECITWRKTFFLFKLKPYPTASWTSWTEWTQCSASCGSGSRLRMRTCNGDSSLCVGDSTETEACETTDCPGAFSKWCTFCQIVKMSNCILWYFTFKASEILIFFWKE